MQPQSPQLRAWVQTLQNVHDIDDLQNHKKSLDRTMLDEAWSLPLCQQAYRSALMVSMVKLCSVWPMGSRHVDHMPATPRGSLMVLPVRQSG